MKVWKYLCFMYIALIQGAQSVETNTSCYKLNIKTQYVERRNVMNSNVITSGYQ